MTTFFHQYGSWIAFVMFAVPNLLLAVAIFIKRKEIREDLYPQEKKSQQ